MRLRTRHLACLLLLLTTLGAAEASVRGGDFSIGGHYISMLMQKNAAQQPAASPLILTLAALPEPRYTAPTAPLRTVWTMPAPAAHAASIHALTGTRS